MNTISKHPIDCQQVDESLPWLVNGSLADEERSSVEAHLAGCTSCREKAREERQAWDLMTCHVPSLALAEYAQGLEPAAHVSREQIRLHVAECASCREEVALCQAASGDAEALPGSVLPFVRPSRSAATEKATPSQWRRQLAVAAVLLATLMTTGLLWQHAEDPSSDQRAVGVVETAMAVDPPQEPPRMAGDLFSDGFENPRDLGWTLVVEPVGAVEARATR